MLLKTLRLALRSLTARETGPVEYPLETERKLNVLHGRAPVDQHLDMLFRDTSIGSEGFVALHKRCLDRTGTGVTPFNVFQRFQTRLALVNYFFSTLQVPGARAECGAYRGATALLLCHAWRSRQPEFNGAGFYLIDSFSGTSASVEQDLIAVRGPDGATHREAFFPAGKTDTSVDEVRGHFREFPDVEICAGWIPEVLASIRDQPWAFVRLDLTLFEPTLAAIEYFYPRLSQGGVMICDGSIFCPGAETAWEQFCEQRDIAYVMLGHRQFVLIK